MHPSVSQGLQSQTNLGRTIGEATCLLLMSDRGTTMGPALPGVLRRKRYGQLVGVGFAMGGISVDSRGRRNEVGHGYAMPSTSPSLFCTPSGGQLVLPLLPLLSC